MIAVVEPDNMELLAIEEEFRNGGIARSVILPAGCALVNDGSENLVDHAGVSEHEHTLSLMSKTQSVYDAQNSPAKLLVGFTAPPAEARVVLGEVAAPYVRVFSLNLM